ncbi:MAG: DUF192 domain-containing protein [Elusimicrobiota bacterium]|jgi:uncharacterized membrane protein (UPF0127 family)|nr:DUF192 domain-containing protein [Elusimicrobiota bacterium]
MQKKLGIKIVHAKTFLDKFIGFMFKKPKDYAIFFDNCRSVHTFFVRFNLNILYLNSDKEVVKILKEVKPFRVTLPYKNAVSILEIPSGFVDINRLEIGDKIF